MIFCFCGLLFICFKHGHNYKNSKEFFLRSALFDFKILYLSVIVLPCLAGTLFASMNLKNKLPLKSSWLNLVISYLSRSSAVLIAFAFCPQKSSFKCNPLIRAALRFFLNSRHHPPRLSYTVNHIKYMNITQ